MLLGRRSPSNFSSDAPLNQIGWEQLLDNEPVNQLLAAYYSEGFLACGGGGDFVLGSTSTHLVADFCGVVPTRKRTQPQSDALLSKGSLACKVSVASLGRWRAGAQSGKSSCNRSLGCAKHIFVWLSLGREEPANSGVNFALEDISCADAPMRAVPYSHQNTSEPPDLTSEPQASGGLALHTMT